VFARFARDRQGASAAEFALIAPVFLTLLFGIFQFGWALHCASSVRYALEESARSVMIDEDFTAGEVESQMRTKLADLAEADIQVQITHDDSRVGTAFVHLNSTYVHPVEVPFIPAFEVTFNQTTSVARPT
jgi:Flp pilus assembly protein TadG